MKAKLIKENNGYTLFVDSKIFAEVDGHQLKSITNRLSLKNCQAIERGYDLDELAKIEYPICEVWNDEEALIRELAFKKGFKKALELIGDKKYSDEDLDKAVNLAYVSGGGDDSYKECEELVKEHLNQQTEWDVEIEMEKVKDETKIVGAVKGVKGSGSKITTYKSVPKLDTDRCLILKGISK